MPFLSHLVSDSGPKKIKRGEEEKKSSTATKHPLAIKPADKNNMANSFEELEDDISSHESDYSGEEEELKSQPSVKGELTFESIQETRS